MREPQDGISKTGEKQFESQTDYLRNYVKNEKVREYYSGKRKSKKLPLGGEVDAGDFLESIKSSKKDMENKLLIDIINANFHGYCEKIKRFLKEIGMEDSAVFKKDRKYVMTKPLVILFDYILDDISGAAGRIGRGRFDKVSMRERSHVFELVDTAIWEGPASKEEKQEAENRLIEKGVCCPIHFEYYQNRMVDIIMECTKKAIVEVGWNPIKEIKEGKVGNLDWEIVVERAYMRLFNKGVLEIDTGNMHYAPGSKLTN